MTDDITVNRQISRSPVNCGWCTLINTLQVDGTQNISVIVSEPTQRLCYGDGYIAKYINYMQGLIHILYYTKYQGQCLVYKYSDIVNYTLNNTV